MLHYLSIRLINDHLIVPSFTSIHNLKYQFLFQFGTTSISFLNCWNWLIIGLPKLPKLYLIWKFTLLERLDVSTMTFTRISLWKAALADIDFVCCEIFINWDTEFPVVTKSSCSKRLITDGLSVIPWEVFNLSHTTYPYKRPQHLISKCQWVVRCHSKHEPIIFLFAARIKPGNGPQFSWWMIT